mmetsp:Transcript_30807/g.31356  ORF Transcript_30807/g.31356 Transcript_30807/m.31356 type:complete len:181 (+) Transcript_30807:146-688(+)
MLSKFRALSSSSVLNGQFRNSLLLMTERMMSTNVVEVKIKDIRQSPWKMNFLVKLVRDKWVPDALAQMKFSPKVRSKEIGNLIQRASILASIRHETIPEELKVQEVSVTKGKTMKRMRIMGRGRTGVGYARWSHITLKLAQIDFDSEIEKATSNNQRERWRKRKELVERKREESGQKEIE